MGKIEEIDDAVIFVGDDGRIIDAGSFQADRAFGPSYSTGEKIEIERIDCHGLVALPGFVDSHTHCVFAGERSLEFTMRAEGKSYQKIAAMGGGILSSVEHVKHASLEEIVRYSKPFLERALSFGTTLMEIKSGYGLSTEEEGKLLMAAKQLAVETPMEIVGTYLGAHAVQKIVQDRIMSDLSSPNSFQPCIRWQNSAMYLWTKDISRAKRLSKSAIPQKNWE